MRFTKAREEEVLAVLAEKPDAHIVFPDDAYRPDGRIVVSRYHRSMFLHRYLYTLTIGNLGPRDFLLQTCRREGCQNPHHYAVYASVHGEPRPRPERTGGNGAKTHCPHGHPYDSANTYSYVTPTGTHYRKCKACTLERARRAHARRKAHSA